MLPLVVVCGRSNQLLNGRIGARLYDLAPDFLARWFPYVSQVLEVPPGPIDIVWLFLLRGLDTICPPSRCSLRSDGFAGAREAYPAHAPWPPPSTGVYQLHNGQF